MTLPPLPAVWHPMRECPPAGVPAMFEVRFSDGPPQIKFWNGRNWLEMAGKFTATGWRIAK